MKKIRKQRIYAKYRVDVWGWLMYQRTPGAFKELLKILYLSHKLPKRRQYAEQYELWKYRKRRKGFGRRRSQYKAYLQEKQKAQYFYGFSKEKQLRQMYRLARKEKGVLKENFLGILESRLLTIAYRMGFFDSMRVGVQYMLHHGLTVDGRRLKRPNYVLGVGECLELSMKDLNGLRHLRRWTTKYKTHKKFPFWGIRKKEKVYYFRYFKKKRFFEKRYKTRSGSGRVDGGKVLDTNAFFWYPPTHLELSALLRKVMLISRPKPKEVFYPYRFEIGRVLAYLQWW